MVSQRVEFVSHRHGPGGSPPIDRVDDRDGHQARISSFRPASTARSHAAQRRQHAAGRATCPSRSTARTPRHSWALAEEAVRRLRLHSRPRLRGHRSWSAAATSSRSRWTAIAPGASASIPQAVSRRTSARHDARHSRSAACNVRGRPRAARLRPARRRADRAGLDDRPEHDLPHRGRRRGAARVHRESPTFPGKHRPDPARVAARPIMRISARAPRQRLAQPLRRGGQGDGGVRACRAAIAWDKGNFSSFRSATSDEADDASRSASR